MKSGALWWRRPFRQVRRHPLEFSQKYSVAGSSLLCWPTHSSGSVLGTRSRQELSTPLMSQNSFGSPSRRALSTNFCRRTRISWPVWVAFAFGSSHDILQVWLCYFLAYRGFVLCFLSTARCPSRFGSFDTSSIGNVREKDEMEDITVSRDGEMIVEIKASTPPQTTRI